MVIFVLACRPPARAKKERILNSQLWYIRVTDIIEMSSSSSSYSFFSSKIVEGSGRGGGISESSNKSNIELWAKNDERSWKVMVEVEWFQRECQLCRWRLETRQGVHRCHLGLWGWSAGGGSQGGSCCFESFLSEHLEEEQTSSSLDLHEGCEARKPDGHRGLLLSLKGKCSPRKSQLFSCFGWWAPIERPSRKPNRDWDRNLSKTDKISFQIIKLQISYRKTPSNKDVCNENGLVQPATEKALVLTDEVSNNTNMKSLDQQVKSMMLISENVDPYQQGRARICKVCGKEGSMQNIMGHIEANHIAGISIPCPRCGKYFKTKNGLQTHKSRHHRNQ